MISPISQALLLKIKIQPNMSEQQRKREIIYDLPNAETKQKNFRNNWRFFMASIKPRP